MTIDLESAFAPDPPASPYDSLVLKFEPRRVALPVEAAPAPVVTHEAAATMLTRGRLYEVVVGPFGTRTQADAQAERICARLGYGDARVIPPAP